MFKSTRNCRILIGCIMAVIYGYVIYMAPETVEHTKAAVLGITK